MKVRKSLCVLLSFLLCFFSISTLFLPHQTVSAQEVVSTNLINNGGFEKTISHSAWVGSIAPESWPAWQPSGKTQLSVDQSVYHSGKQSISIASLAPASRASVSQTFDAKAEKTYKISAWVKTSDATKAVVQYAPKQSTGTTITSINISTLSGTQDWTKVEYTTTTPANCGKIQIALFLETGTGKVWFDDVQVIEWNAAKGLTLDPDNAQIDVGGTVNLTPVFDPINTTDQSIVWTSSNEQVATVENGTVTGHSQGVASIMAKSNDGGFTATSIIIVGASSSIVAQDYNGEVDENSVLEGQLTALNPNGAPVRFALANQPRYGAANISLDGAFCYYPQKNFYGEDEFKVIAMSDNEAPKLINVNIKVSKVNQAPVNQTGWFYTPKGSALQNVLKFYDREQSQLIFSKTADPLYGSIDLMPDGQFVYTPESNYIGFDHFSVSVSDGQGGIKDATCTVYVGPVTEDIIARLQDNLSDDSHPRLLASAEDFAEKRSLLESDRYLKGWYEALKEETDPLLAEPATPYKPNAGSTYDVRKKLINLGIMYQLTKDEKYAERAWKELENAADYPEWGGTERSSLLTAEMSFGIALGYDWIYEYLNDAQRTLIRQAIKEKTLAPALKWYRGEITHNADMGNNINLVVNGGFGIAALAVADEEPEGAEVIQGIYNKLQTAIKYYSADGGWPEGPAYWHYGGQYLTYFIAAMNNLLGVDYGLSSMEGFANSADFPYHMMGEGGIFNFSDGSLSIVQPESLWFAKFYNNNEYAWYIGHLFDSKGLYDPLSIVLYEPGMLDVKPSQLDKTYSGVETASLRSAWGDPSALYVGIKGKDHKLESHYDLDSGTFVFDALGERWALDMGNENYGLPGFWDYGYQRWTYYHKKTEGHNTLVINPNENPVVQQDPQGVSKIVELESKPKGAYTVLDMTGAYAKDAVDVKRGMMLFNNRSQFLMQDEIKLKKPSELYWFMHTKAGIEIIEDGKAALLTQNGKRLYVKLLGDQPEAKFTFMKADPLPTSPNPDGQSARNGIYKLAIHLEDVTDALLSIWMVPLLQTESIPKEAPKVSPIQDWVIEDGEIDLPSLNGINLDGVPLKGFNLEQRNYFVDLHFETEQIPVVSASGSNVSVQINRAMTLPGIAEINVKDNINPDKVGTYYVIFNPTQQTGLPSNYLKADVLSVTASEVPEADKGNTPDKTIDGSLGDGSLGTRWSAPGEQWIQYDLGEIKQVGAVSIAYYLGDKRKAFFDIAVSRDGESWTGVYSGQSSGKTLEQETYRFTDIPVRYVRILGHGNSDSNYNSITEVSIFEKINVSGISLNKRHITLNRKVDSLKLTARVSPENATIKYITWTSSDENVAVVSNDGTVVAVGKGKATIKAVSVDGGFSATCEVVVGGALTTEAPPIEPVPAKSPILSEMDRSINAFIDKLENKNSDLPLSENID